MRKIIYFTAEVEDPDTKKIVSNSLTKILHTDAYLWIKLPYYSAKNSWIDFSAVVLDYEAKALSWKKNFKLEVYKRTYNSVQKQGVDGNFYYDYSVDDKLENTLNFTTDKNGKVSTKITPKSTWNYFIKAIYSWKNGKTFISTREIFVSSENYVDFANWE